MEQGHQGGGHSVGVTCPKGFAIQKVPAMRKYSGHISNVFVVIMGLIAISAIFYSLFS